MSSIIWTRSQSVCGRRSSTIDFEGDNRLFAFERNDRLFAVEAEILCRLKGEFKDLAILELGMGAGRLSNDLLNISRDYVGIDCYAEAVHTAREAYSGIDIRQMDARDLSAFDNTSFDLIWFAFNGIDYNSHDDRMSILFEVRRLIKPNGAFVFSSHNIDSEVRSAFSLSHINRTKGLLSAAKSLARYVRGIGNAIIVGRSAFRSKDYAILNDEANSYRDLTYYISLEKQIEQLQIAGFKHVQAFGMEGEILPLSERYSDGSMIHYVARPQCMNNTKSDVK